MKLHEALEAVSRIYVPGVIAYYARLSPDPWQQAHDELEKIAGSFDPKLVAPACARFVARCEELIGRFRLEGQPNKARLTSADAFALGSIERYDQAASRKDRRCIRCDSKSDLSFASDPGDPMKVFIICRKCKPAQPAKGNPR